MLGNLFNRQNNTEPGWNWSHTLLWGNIPDMRDSYLDFFGEKVPECFLHFKEPFAIYTGLRRIQELEETVLSDNQVNFLNKHILHIFLYEPICFFIDNFNREFYSEFPYDVDINRLHSLELESIEIFAEKYNLHIKVCTCDYGIEVLQNKYEKLMLVCFDAFIRSGHGKKKVKWPKSLFIKRTNIDRKFWSGNWRYTIHRHLVMSYLSNFEGYYSWHIHAQNSYIEQNEWFNIDRIPTGIKEKLIIGARKLLQTRYSIDHDGLMIDANGIDDVCIPSHTVYQNTNHDNFYKSYDSSFCAIITETRFAQPFGNFSEKTLVAASMRIPFILVGPPKTLEYLKRFGFKTFDKWWDESYDQELDHEKRLLKIYELINYIDSKSLDELIEIRNQMHDVLENNYRINQNLPFNQTYIG